MITIKTEGEIGPDQDVAEVRTLSVNLSDVSCEFVTEGGKALVVRRGDLPALLRKILPLVSPSGDAGVDLRNATRMLQFCRLSGKQWCDSGEKLQLYTGEDSKFGPEAGGTTLTFSSQLGVNAFARVAVQSLGGDVPVDLRGAVIAASFLLKVGDLS